jgi:C4-type Zn-finger protein
MQDDWKAWVEVGKAIAADAKVKVTCPVCAKATLEVWDVPWEAEPKRWERHMQCPFCGAYNSLRMKDKPSTAAIDTG